MKSENVANRMIELDKRVNGTTKLTGLIGNPVGHSVSPILHNSLFSIMDINGIYIPMQVSEGKLGTAVNGLKAAGFKGFNITIPYKEAILEHLDEVSEEAALLGAVNTVKIANGKLIGYNTDGEGFIRAFRNQTGTDFKGKAVCILGAGGTARTLSVKVAMEGAGKICIINRTQKRSEELVAYISPKLPDCTISKLLTPAGSVFTAAAGSDEARRILTEYDVIINTTSAGMHPDTDTSPIEEDAGLSSKTIVFDVIYNPIETKLLRQARQKGCKTVNGAGMLYYQGIRAFEIWMGITVPEKISHDLSTEFLKYLEV